MFKTNALVVSPFLKVSGNLVSHSSNGCLLISFKRYSLYLYGVSTPPGKGNLMKEGIHFSPRVKIFTKFTLFNSRSEYTIKVT